MNSGTLQSSVLFVCTGNICRSPTAEGVFARMVRDAGLAGRIAVDSAGTQGYHAGEPPDARATSAARLRGYEISQLRARKFERRDFSRFDYVIAMDEHNRAFLARQCQPADRFKLRMMMEFARRHPAIEVPDPYYGGPAGFERVLEMIEDAAQGLLDAITSNASWNPNSPK